MSIMVKASGLNLAESTKASATASEIAQGYTAWVNGKLLTGTAKISKTVVLEHSGDFTHTFQFDGEPKAVLVQFGYNGDVRSFGTFMKISNAEYKNSAGSPGQSVEFGATSVTAHFYDGMGSAYTPYMKVTAIF